MPESGGEPESGRASLRGAVKRCAPLCVAVGRVELARDISFSRRWVQVIWIFTERSRHFMAVSRILNRCLSGKLVVSTFSDPFGLP